MAVSAHDLRIARATTRAQDAGARAAGEATDQALQDAYEMGLAGDKLTFGADDDPRLREEHRRGLDERARARRRQHARTITRSTGGYLARVGRSVTDRAAEIPTPSGGGSVVGVLVGVLALVVLFLLLNHSNLTAGVVGGVLGATKWLVAPSVLPF